MAKLKRITIKIHLDTYKKLEKLYNRLWNKPKSWNELISVLCDSIIRKNGLKFRLEAEETQII